MRQADWHSRFEGPTLLCAPLGWDCFGKDEEIFKIPFRKRFMKPEYFRKKNPKTNSVRVRPVS